MDEEICDQIILEVKQLRVRGMLEDAFRKIKWLRDEILSENPSIAGGLGYFVLAEWFELSQVYPPARRGLEVYQGDIINSLRSGTCDKESFCDLEYLNGVFQNTQATIDLFREIEASRPDFANEVARVVLDVLIEHGEHRWARKYMQSPECEYSRLKRTYNESMLILEEMTTDSNPSQSAISGATEVIEEGFAEEVLRLIDVLRHTDEMDAADYIENDAVSLVGERAFLECARRSGER